MIAERRERSVIGYSIFLMGNKNIEGVGRVEQGNIYISGRQYCQTMVLRLCSLFMSLHSRTACNEAWISMSISRLIRVSSFSNGTPPYLLRWPPCLGQSCKQHLGNGGKKYIAAMGERMAEHVWTPQWWSFSLGQGRQVIVSVGRGTV